MCTIDASRAIARLELKQPVVFEFEQLTQLDPLAQTLGGNEPIVDGRIRPTPDDVHHIIIDLDAAHFMEEDLRHVIAHELVHCAQIERAGSYLRATIRAVYENSHADYGERPSERDAERRAPELKELITISQCDSSYPVTAGEASREMLKMLPELRVEFEVRAGLDNIVRHAGDLRDKF